MSRNVRVSTAQFNTILTQAAAAALIAQTLVRDNATKLMYAKRGADHDFVLTDTKTNVNYTVKHFTHGNTGQAVVRITFEGDDSLDGDCDKRLQPLAEATNAKQTNYLFPNSLGAGHLTEDDAHPEVVTYNTPEGTLFVEDHSTPDYFQSVQSEMRQNITDSINEVVMKQISRLGGTKFDIDDRINRLSDEIANVIDQLVERNETRLLMEQTKLEQKKTAPAPTPEP